MKCSTETGIVFDAGSLYEQFGKLKDNRKRKGLRYELVTHEGVIAMSVAYMPWSPPLCSEDASRGDVLAYYGSGGIDFGYLGGIYDENTGLIYMGGGQYYDPVTGRMLTRETEQSNPYKLGAYDPAGMMVAPLALLGLVLGKKKKRPNFSQNNSRKIQIIINTF